MKIVFTLADDGQSLILSNVVDTHNHEVSKETFKLLPRKRQLDREEKEEVLKLKRLKCNKTLLKEYIQQKTGKSVLLRDLSNIRATTSSNSDLLEVAKILQDEEEKDSVTELLIDADNVLQGIYFQNSLMRHSFSLYPELVLLDATYKLNNLRMPFYVLMSVDGNNAGVVVATFFLQTEDSESIAYMLKIFKEHNELWSKIRTVLTDKDFSERRTLADEFPNANLLLCLFHTLKSFRTNITSQAMDINSDERQVVLNLLQKMAYSKTEDDYEKSYKDLISLNFAKVSKYFNDNWHSCKEQWVECFKQKCCTYGVATTNHLESFNQKIKSVCTKHSSLQRFYEEFKILLKSVHSERKQTCLHMISKKLSCLRPSSPHEKYFRTVTPFAFKFIESSLSKSDKVKFHEEYEEYCILEKSLLKVSQNICQCINFIDMQLPCKHIFKFRELKGLALYSEDLIPDRFKKDLYFQNYGLDFSKAVSKNANDLNMDSIIASPEHIKIQMRCKRSILTQQQKYTRVLAKCQQIATIISEMSMNDFNEHYSQLETLVNMWNERKRTIIVEQVFSNEDSDTIVSLNMNSSMTEVPSVVGEFEYSFAALGSGVEEQSVVIPHYEEPECTGQELCLKSVTEERKKSDTFEKRLEDVETKVSSTEISSKNINFPEPISQEFSPRPSNEDKIERVEMGKDKLVLLQDIKMPLKMKRRGRPKGLNVTVIGLNRKRIKKDKRRNKRKNMSL